MTDLENQERFNNKSLNTYPNKSSSYRDRKKSDERISNFNLSVPLTLSNLTPFAHSFEKAKSSDTQLQFLNALLKADPTFLDKYKFYKNPKLPSFTQTKAFGALARLLSEAAFQLPSKSEIVERSLTYLSKINLNKDMLTRSRVHQAVENVKNCEQASEELKDKSFRILVKWRKTIDEWISDDGEREARNYERDQQLQESQKQQMRRGNNRPNRRERSSSYSEEKSFDSPKDKRRRRESPRRRNKDEKYLRKRSNREVYEDDDRYSASGSVESEQSPIKRGVYWNEGDLVAVKFFLATDEPSHPGLSPEEVKKIQDEIAERQKTNGFMITPDDLKHRESRLEGNSMKMKKDNEREIQQKLDALSESIKWYEPKRIKLDDIVELGKTSLEKREHDQRINGKLPSMYAKEYQIPDQPSFDNIINKSMLCDRPVIIPLCNADGEEEIITAVKHLEEKKADKKNDSKSAKPLKSILKKKKKEDNDDLDEDKAKQLAKKKLNIDPEIVLKLFSGENTQEEQELFTKALKESGRQADISKNIETLKKFLENVHKIKATEKAQNPVPEPRKIVKTNEEPEVNMMRSVQDDQFFQQQMHLQQNYNQMQDLQDSGSPGDGSKKVSYKPHNYKTVPCVFFHSQQGCSRGDNCHFIHDWNYSGRETPNMRKYVRNTLIGNNPKDGMLPPNAMPMGSSRIGGDIPLERPQQQTFQGINSNIGGGGNHFYPQQQQQQQQQQPNQHQQHHQVQHHQQQHHQQDHFSHHNNHNQRPNFNHGGNMRNQNNNFNNQRTMSNQFGGQHVNRPQQQPPIRNDMMFQGGPPMHGQPYQPPNFFHQQQPQQFHHQQHHQQGNMHMGGNMQNRHMMNQQHGNYGS